MTTQKGDRNRNRLPTNLPQLQNLIKRDKTAYKDEFLQQYQHYQSLLQLFLLNPSQESDSLRNLVMFLSQICHCYCEEMANFPNELMSLLGKHGPILEPEIRMTLCRGLILMRNKDFIEPQRLLTLFFELFRCEDKILRKALFSHIVSDIKHINTKRKDNKVNLSLQNLMYRIFGQSSAMMSRMSLNVMIELYRKNIWNDAKTVNVIATACFSKVSKMCVAAFQFFLTGEDSKDDDNGDSSSEEEDEARMMRSYIVSKQTIKKGRKRERKMRRALSAIKQNARKKKKKMKSSRQAAVFSALHLLNDPQDFSEKLFHKLEGSKDKFEVKLMMMSLISRLVGLHQLILFNFYPYLQTSYSRPGHISDVPKMLTYLAQSTHKLVPPEILEAPLRAIVNTFVSERNSSDVMAVGLNAVREVCVRCPLVMSEDLLRDLTAYKSYRNKSVMMAARSLIHLYRDINPEMLHRKDRGRPTEAAGSALQKLAEFGALDAAEVVPGIELIDFPLEGPVAVDDVEEDSDGGFGLSDVVEEEEELAEEEREEEMAEEEGKKKMAEEEGEAEMAEEEGVEVRDDADMEDSLKKNEGLDVCEKKDDTRPNIRLEHLKQQRKEAAALVSTTRFLTQEEFAMIRQKQLSSSITPRKGKKRQLEDLLEEQELRRQENGELLSEAAIHTVPHARMRRNKEERLASIREGREGREKFGSKKRKFNPESSSTNKQKSKNKAFPMIKHKRSIRGKKKKSFREKQISLRNSLLKQRKHK